MRAVPVAVDLAPRRVDDLHGDLHDHPGRPGRRLGDEHRATAHQRHGTSTTDTETVTARPEPGADARRRRPPRPRIARSGDVINYSYLVTNTGNVTLAGPVTVTDDKATRDAARPAGLRPGRDHDLHRDATRSPRPTSNAGSVTNTARGPRRGHRPPTTDDETVTAVADADRSALVKTATPTTYRRVGNVISYSYMVTNTGNVTLTGPFTVTDDKATMTLSGGRPRPRRVHDLHRDLHDHPGRPGRRLGEEHRRRDQRHGDFDRPMTRR